MKMKAKYLLTLFSGLALTLSSCLGDLDVQPLDENVVTGEIAYSDAASYTKGLMKIYSVWAISGQDGEGSSDIENLDPGNAQLLRSWWNLQEVSTDECKVAWANDSWVPEINNMTWSNSKNESIEGVYQRCMFIVALANEYLKQVGNAPTDANPTQLRAEARFCRALAYYVLMDQYARPPFITESNYSVSPSPLSREELFGWIVKELTEIEKDLPAARQGIYGRADQGAVNALLARAYLNAEVYTGKAMYTECITACNKVIAGGYALTADYSNIFKADNNVVAKNEIIFPICFDGAATKTWGGMTFLICSSRGGAEYVLATDGVSSGWDGTRSTQNLVNKFAFSSNNKTAANIIDKRGIFYSEGRSVEIKTTPLGTFTSEGWAVYKFKNVKSNGSLASDTQFPDTDFPMLRLGDVYLMYAEAVLRGGAGGDKNTALGYVNELRKRGYGDDSGAITSTELTTDFILDERSRELYWEGTRRTDLIRYGLYTSGSYRWPFKGGVLEGVGVDNTRNIFPIPVTDLSVNGNLTQNPGY
ncbi:RagB/SusD family nutrient uptake outer membrane protein [Dysgonomonas mossii]|nr:RagB/SusD family nutrient uptake outer membrane protein [Dysgonomonas mossii]MBF0759950.1 RagB/SusD family nutrient uptake outer membrane protein [Dysgonomonas mossii]